MRKMIGIAAVVGAMGIGALAMAQQDDGQPQATPPPAKAPAATAKAPGELDRAVAGWPAKARALAYILAKKYGPPDEIGASKLMWNGNGPWKRTVLTREETPHDFPKPHMDLLEQVIDYRVPADRIDDISRMDGSVTVDRTRGELRARCDSEEANFLAINLAAEVAKGRDATEARSNLVNQIRALMTMAQPPALASDLRVEPTKDAGDRDKVVMSGAPVRTSGTDLNDGSILGILAETDTAEIMMGKFGAQHAQRAELKQFAKMMQTEHAQALDRLMKLAVAAKIQGAFNEVAQGLEKKDDEALARIASKSGSDLDREFIDTAVLAHGERLQMIDKQLMEQASNAQVKQELARHRQMISHHLDEARKLQKMQKTSMR